MSKKAKQLMSEHGIDEIVVHAPYIINLGSYKKNTFRAGGRFFAGGNPPHGISGVRKYRAASGRLYGQRCGYGINRIAEGLNEVLDGT